MSIIKVKLDGLGEFDVEYSFHKGYPATRDEPGAEDEWEFLGAYNADGDEINSLLSDYAVECLMTEVKATLAARADEAGIDDYDY